MTLDLSHLSNSLAALERAQKITKDATAWQALGDDLKEAVTAGVIQSFEVAYEQSWKLMRRWLEANPLEGDAESVTMRQLYRIAAKAGLIDDVDQWMGFHKARNQTSHTYDLSVAEAVFATSFEFAPVALKALAVMESNND
jgi:nucleotidyltransferase substrate binding protein (TIGR01987 family)